MRKRELENTAKSGWSYKEITIAMGSLLAGLGVYYFPFLTGRSYLWEDLLYMIYPFFSYLTTSLAEGHFPLWVCGQRGGLPFFCESWVYYPPLWGLTLFVSDGQLSSLAVQWYCVGQLFLAGLFAYLFLAAHKLNLVAKITGMVVFVFSAFLSVHIVNGAMGHAFIWLPLELLFVKKIMDGDRVGQSYIYLILSITCSYLAGFPQYVLYNGYLMGLYWVFIYWQKKQLSFRSPLGRTAIALACEVAKVAGVFVVVALLCLFVILPTAQAWGMSVRQEFGYSKIADESMPWYYLIHGLVPNFFGSSNGDGSGIPFWGFNKDTTAYQIWHGGYWMYMEFSFYAGQITLVAWVIALFNIKRLWKYRPEAVFFLFALFPILLFMTGRYGGLFQLCYHMLPGISMFRTPPRINALLIFCLAALATLVLSSLLDKKSEMSVKKPLMVVSGLYAVFLIWFFSFGVKTFPELADPVRYTHALTQTIHSILLFGAMAVVVYFISKADRPNSKTIGGIALVLLTFLDLYLAFHRFHQGRTNPEQYYADRNGLISQMAKLREEQGPFRFAQLRDGKINEEVVFPRNMGYMQPGYEALEGYVLFNLKGFAIFHTITNQKALLDIQNVRVIANADSRTRQVSLSQYTNSLPRAKFYHDIRAYSDAIALCSDLDSGRLDYHHALGVLKEDCVKYRISTSAPPQNAEAKIHFTPVNSDEYRISYQTTVPGVIFISESYYPGWEADGGRYPVIHAFGPFKGIVISEAGSGVITVKFSPRTLWLGLMISGVTLVLLLVAWAVFVRRDQRCRAERVI